MSGSGRYYLTFSFDSKYDCRITVYLYAIEKLDPVNLIE